MNLLCGMMVILWMVSLGSSSQLLNPSNFIVPLEQHPKELTIYQDATIVQSFSSFQLPLSAFRIHNLPKFVAATLLRRRGLGGVDAPMVQWVDVPHTAKLTVGLLNVSNSMIPDTMKVTPTWQASVFCVPSVGDSVVTEEHQIRRDEAPPIDGTSNETNYQVSMRVHTIVRDTRYVNVALSEFLPLSSLHFAFGSSPPPTGSSNHNYVGRPDSAESQVIAEELKVLERQRANITRLLETSRSIESTWQSIVLNSAKPTYTSSAVPSIEPLSQFVEECYKRIQHEKFIQMVFRDELQRVEEDIVALKDRLNLVEERKKEKRRIPVLSVEFHLQVRIEMLPKLSALITQVVPVNFSGGMVAASFDVQYLTDRVRWRPSYDISISTRASPLDDDDGDADHLEPELIPSELKVTTVYLARISNSFTFELFRNVRLKLSTGSTFRNVGGDPNLADPWYIKNASTITTASLSGSRGGTPQRTFGHLEAQSETSMPPRQHRVMMMKVPFDAMHDDEDGGATVEIHEAAAQLGVDETFILQGRYSLFPGDETTVTIATTETTSATPPTTNQRELHNNAVMNVYADHVAIPKVSNGVYFRMYIVNRSPYTYLPGQGRLYVDGKLVSRQANIKMTSVNGTLMLSAGSREGVDCVRRTLPVEQFRDNMRRSSSPSSGLMQLLETFFKNTDGKEDGVSGKTMYYELELTNRRRATLYNLTVQDQIPIPDSETRGHHGVKVFVVEPFFGEVSFFNANHQQREECAKEALDCDHRGGATRRTLEIEFDATLSQQRSSSSFWTRKPKFVEGPTAAATPSVVLHTDTGLLEWRNLVVPGSGATRLLTLLVHVQHPKGQVSF